MKERPDSALPSSFRDPSGYVFLQNGNILRQVNESYRYHYDYLLSSGLLAELVSRGFLVAHKELPVAQANPEIYKIIQPDVIPFISYPFEWCFSQLRDASLLTLDICQLSLRYGMILKDASAYNVQFKNGKPILLDTLSFERYIEGQPWQAYRQFCQHFVAPLALMSFVDVRLGQILRGYLDGVPLEMACRILPVRSRLSFGISTHLFMHARLQSYSQNRVASARTSPSRNLANVSRRAMFGLLESLRSLILKLRWNPSSGSWWRYYEETNYTRESMQQKETVVAKLVRTVCGSHEHEIVAWDLGANTGRFSRIAAHEGCRVIAIDADPAAAERHYLECKLNGTSRILPLFIDLANPTGSFGWACEERQSLVDRGPSDLVLALALVHHLAIGNNVPLDRIAEFFSRLCSWLIVEFVPKEDSQTQRLLQSRPDVFPDYSRIGFERAFSAYFSLVAFEKLSDSLRGIYLFKKNAK